MKNHNQIKKETPVPPCTIGSLVLGIIIFLAIWLGIFLMFGVFDEGSRPRDKAGRVIRDDRGMIKANPYKQREIVDRITERARKREEGR